MERKQIQQTMISLLEDETGENYENVSAKDNLFEDLGLDSVDLISLVLAVESHYRIKLSTKDLQEVTEVGEVVDLIYAELPKTQRRAA